MDDKGYTLVELLVTMLISVVVMTIVISFLATNSRSYSYASEEVDLQMESQSVMNQLYDVIVEARWMELVSINSSEMVLLLYSNEDIDAVFLNKDEEQLYYVQNQTPADIANLASITYSEQENLMAEHVKDISIYPTDAAMLLKEQQVSLSVDFHNMTMDYRVERDIKIRNELVMP